jgi:hypothetical protein
MGQTESLCRQYFIIAFASMPTLTDKGAAFHT